MQLSKQREGRQKNPTNTVFEEANKMPAELAPLTSEPLAGISIAPRPVSEAPGASAKHGDFIKGNRGVWG